MMPKYSDIKSKISSKIQKQTKSKPSLRETMTTSHKAAEKFVKELKDEQNLRLLPKSIRKGICKITRINSKKAEI